MDELEQVQFDEMMDLEVKEMEKDMEQDVGYVLEARGKVHGDFKMNSLISQYLKDTARDGDNWENLSHVEKEAIDMILHKVSRAVNGTYNEDDYIDIAGYATLVVRNKK